MLLCFSKGRRVRLRGLGRVLLCEEARECVSSIGFVTFARVESAEEALQADPEHLILDGRYGRLLCAKLELRLCRALRVSVPVPKHQGKAKGGSPSCGDLGHQREGCGSEICSSVGSEVKMEHPEASSEWY